MKHSCMQESACFCMCVMPRGKEALSDCPKSVFIPCKRFVQDVFSCIHLLHTNTLACGAVNHLGICPAPAALF